MARSQASRAPVMAKPTRTILPSIDLRCAMGVPAAKVLRDPALGHHVSEGVTKLPSPSLLGHLWTIK